MPDGHLASDQRIADRIRAEAEAYFGPELIAGIDLRRDTGPDDEPVVFVTVVYRKRGERLPVNRTMDFRMRIWEMAVELGLASDPVTSFTPEAEFVKRHAGVA